MRPLTGQSAYQQLAEIIRERIADGTYPTGSQLPNEDALGKEFYVSRVTVNRALQELRNDGTIYVRRGIGVFVSPPAEAIELQDVPQYVLGRLEAGDTLLFRRPDGTIDPISVTKTE